MAILDGDKYYTPKDLAKRLIDTTFRILKENNKKVTSIIEPSAGDGAFSSQLSCRAYDIDPKCDGIIQADFLSVNVGYKEGRLIIGNPPFGVNNWKSLQFFKKSYGMCDYIAFIQPIALLNNNIKVYEFDLLYSEDLGIVDFSGVELHCCFNIYVRPKNGKLNKKPTYVLKDISIIEHRRKKGDYHTAQNKPIPPNYDYAMCNWGDGCLGKVPEYIGQYAQEVYFYCRNKKYLQQMKNLLEFNTIRGYVKSISSKRISVMGLYKYLKENIEGVQ